MHKAERMEILLADEVDSCVPHCRCGSWIIAAIKKRKLGNGTAGVFNGKDLLAAIGRTLEDPHTAALNHKQAGAGIALCKKQFALAVVARYSPFSKELEFGFSEPVEDLDTSKDFQSLRYRSHDRHFKLSTDF